MPDLTSSNDPRRLRLDEVIGAFLVALDAGQNPIPADWLARHPDLHPELAEFFADRQRMDELVEPLRASPDTTTVATDDNISPASSAIEIRVRYFGDYELLKVLGEGGMGIVYKARQISLNRPVALKMIKAARFATDDDVRRFQNEAEAVARLDHPNIVPIFEVGRFEDQHYFSMKLIAGKSLDKQLKNYLGEPRRVAELVAVTADAIHHAHQRGILHRDLKPANVLLDAEGQPHVTDFGLAKRVEGDSELTQSGAILGTPAYMAPEQASGTRGVVTTSTDVHGLGAILFALLTGRAPFGGATVLDTLEQVRERTPDSPRKLNPRVPRDLEVICLKCLEKDPRRRYASADALAADLRHSLAGEPIAARPVGSAARFRMWCRRNPVVAAAGGLVAAALVAVAVVSLLYAGQQKRLAVAEKRYGDEQTKRAEEQTRYAEEQTEAATKIGGLAKSLEKEGQNLKTSLADSNRRLAMVYFERARRSFEDEDIPAGMVWLVESWRAAIKANDTAWQRLARINLSYWRYQRPELKGVLRRVNPSRWFSNIAFSPDGQVIVTACQDGTARVWDSATCLPIGKPLNHGGVNAVAFNPNGKTVVTGGFDSTLRVWDLDTQEAVGHPMRTRQRVNFLAFSPDGATLLSRGLISNSAQLWNVASQNSIGNSLGFPYTDRKEGVAFNPDAKTVVAVGNDATATVCDFSGPTPISRRVQGLSKTAHSMAFSPDGKDILVSDWDGVRIWDAALTRPVGRPLVHSSLVRPATFSLAVSQDGKTVLVGGSDNAARIWDLASQRAIGQLMRHQREVNCVAFSPDGKTALTGSSDGTARLWDAATAESIGYPIVQRSSVESVNFSPDGKVFLTIDTNGVPRLWNSSTKQLIGSPLSLEVPIENRSLSSVSLSPDGKTIAGGNDFGTVRQWEIANGKLTRTFSAAHGSGLS
jgi:WD40 repeat protein